MTGVQPPESGTVLSFDEHVGLGEVRNDRGTWPFHCTSILDGSRRIAAGTSVLFDVGPGGPGRWEASNLRPMVEE